MKIHELTTKSASFPNSMVTFLAKWRVVSGRAERKPMDPTDIREQISLAADGDAAAFEQLFDQYSAALKRFIEMRLDDRLRRRVDCSDIMQETRITLHRKLKSFAEDQPMPFRLLMLKTAQDRLRDAHRDHIRRQRRSADREVLFSQHSATSIARKLANQSSPSQRLMREEEQAKVAQLISQLPEGDREMLMMRHVEELKYDEIALLMEINVPTARKRYTRALLRLQKLLEAEGLG